MVHQPFVSSCRCHGLRATGQNIRYGGVNCALGPSKSIRYSGVCFHIFYFNSARLSYVVRYSGVFVIAGFVIARFVSTYFTVILPGFHMLFVIAGFVIARFVSTYFAVILPGFHMLFVIAGSSL